MGVGSATGKDKAEEAAREAISSPLLETSIKGAKGILISISVSPDVGLEEVDLASTLISQEANPDANIIWGVAFDNELEDEMRITIIATGFEKKPEDANRNTTSLRPNQNSPYKTTVRTAPVQAPVVEEKPVQTAAPVKPAQPAVKKVVKPAPKPAARDEDDDFGDLFGMLKKK
jgi:cell division protein FtsZ